MIENIDCFEKLKSLEDKSVQLVLSDPPYGIAFGGNDWDSLSKEKYIDLIYNYLALCREKLKDNGSVILFFAPSMTNELFKAVDKSGMTLHLEFWKSICRQKGRGAKSKLKSQREDLILVTKSDSYLFNHISDLFSYKEPVTNILNYYTGEVERPKFDIDDTVYCFKMPYYLSKTEKQIHSCQKSILLLYALIKNFTDENDLVFDGFAGSGSCNIAATLASRKFVGCELDYDMAMKANKWIDSFDYKSYRKDFFKNEKWFGVA